MNIHDTIKTLLTSEEAAHAVSVLMGEETQYEGDRPLSITSLVLLSNILNALLSSFEDSTIFQVGEDWVCPSCITARSGLLLMLMDGTLRVYVVPQAAGDLECGVCGNRLENGE